tara:strand:- start:1253 stop:1456 length:204 start_codon:yes stop_codon:yes gene_type:complete
VSLAREGLASRNVHITVRVRTASLAMERAIATWISLSVDSVAGEAPRVRRATQGISMGIGVRRVRVL